MLLPTFSMVEHALGDEELNDVLQARAEATAARRYVQRGQVVGRGMARARQQMRQGTAMAVELDVRVRPGSHVAGIVKAEQRRSIDVGEQVDP
jgi:hypothetical protein